MPASNWEQLDGRLKAVSLALKEGHPPPEDPADLIQETVLEAAGLQVSRQRDLGIDLLESAMRSFPDNPKLRRQAALAYGGKFEDIMNLADRLGVTPGPVRLPFFQTMLERGVQLDPVVPDLHWDLAVLKARFAQDFSGAEKDLAAANQLGYRHPRMQQLESMIREGFERPVPQVPVEEEPGETQLKQLIWALVLWPEWPPDEGKFDPENPPLKLGESAFESYCQKATDLVREGKLDIAAFERVRQAAVVLGGDAAEYAADLLRVTAAEFGDAKLLAGATNAHLRILARMSSELRNQVAESTRSMRRAKVTRAESRNTLPRPCAPEGSRRMWLTQRGCPLICRLGITAARFLRLQCTDRNMNAR